MSRYPLWTEDEDQLLAEQWGIHHGGVPGIAEKLGRSIRAVRIRALHLNLGPWLQAADYITLNQLRRTILAHESVNGYGEVKKRWMRLGLPVRYKRVDTCRWKVVYMKDFWRWANEHRGDLDFAHFPENALGEEPRWVKEKRRQDILNRLQRPSRRTLWSQQEIAYLGWMLERGATWMEIEQGLRRSGNAIKIKANKLHLHSTARPPRRRWSEAEAQRLLQMVGQGWSIERCAKDLRRTSGSVHGKIEYMRKTGQMV